MHEVQETLAGNPQSRLIFPDNPCHLGFLFQGVQEGMLYCAGVYLFSGLH